MKHAKTVFAIYVGIYLILPNCFCQVLTAFGIDADHLHSTSQVIESELEFSSEISITSPICHCDDVCSKTATTTTLDIETVDLKWAESDVILTSIDLPEVEDNLSIHPRGPPDNKTCWSLAPFSGVYLL